MNDTIAELTVLEKKATPGLWRTKSERACEGACETILAGKEPIADANEKTDAALIVAMRNKLPELLSELTSLQHSNALYECLVEKATKANADYAAALSRAEKAEAQIRWLAEQVVNAKGMTAQGGWLASPVEQGCPVHKDKIEAINAWVQAAQEAAKRVSSEV